MAPHTHRLLAAAALVAAGLGLSSCGITDPYTSRTQAGPPPATTPSTAQGPTTATTNADPLPERGGTIPAAAQTSQRSLAAGAGEPTPQDAVARYGRVSINWTARTVAQVQRRLATLSLDGARAQALQAAARYQRDTTLASSHVANAGTVVSIAPGQADAAGEWVVVTREHTTGGGDYAGLPATLHVTYARVTQQPTGWVVTAWSPQD